MPPSALRFSRLRTSPNTHPSPKYAPASRTHITSFLALSNTSTLPLEMMNMCRPISPIWKIICSFMNDTSFIRMQSSVTNTWSSRLPSPSTSKSGTLWMM